MGKWEKFFRSRSDAAQFLRLLGRNCGPARASVTRRYRALLHTPPVPNRWRTDTFGRRGVADPPDLSRYLERICELDAHALLIRLPSWEPEPVFALHDELARLREGGTRFTFTSCRTANWSTTRSAGAHSCAGGRAPRDLEPTFQLGHAINGRNGDLHPTSMSV